MRAPRSMAVILAAAVLLVVSTGLAVAWLLVGGRPQDSEALARAQHEAIDAARTTATAINSYDYRSIDEQFTVVQGALTGAVLDNFQKTRASVRAGFVSSKISSSASVLAAGLTSGNRHEATVLVWLSVTTTTDGKNSVQQAPLRLHLVERHATWLADQIATVG